MACAMMEFLLQWGPLIGWDGRHRRNSARQSPWSSEPPKL